MWIDIIGWENLYSINEYGEVKNKETNKLIIGDTNSAGYSRICLYRKGHTPNKQRFFRHRLVAIHFIPNLKTKPEVNHINGNKLDNNVYNLEWVTQKENIANCRNQGRLYNSPITGRFTSGLK